MSFAERLGDGPDRWGPVSRALHWAIAALILFQLAFGVWMVRLDDVIARFAWTQVHKSWGTVVFVLALLLILWRMANPVRPGLPAGTPWTEALAARAVQALLYLAMLAMPVSGWVMVSASPTQDLLGMQNLVFGTVPLPDPWVPGSAAIEAGARSVHVACAVALAALVAMHTGAALWHQVVRRDRVLAAMVRGR